MPKTQPSILLLVRREFARLGDPKRAAGQQAYMKSAMPYHGIASTPLRSACKTLFANLAFSSPAVWNAMVLSLWRGAKFREERYAAIALTGHKLAKPYQTPAAMPLYEEIIVTGAWWDYVDDVASHRVGPILRDHPAPMKKMMRAWSKSPDMWKRRTSIICQLGFKKETDLNLLYACIEPSLYRGHPDRSDAPVRREAKSKDPSSAADLSKQFFIQKAIGWALRQYAWTNPTEVKQYVRDHRNRLSPLSIREALKNVRA